MYSTYSVSLKSCLLTHYIYIYIYIYSMLNSFASLFNNFFSESGLTE